MGKYSNLKSSLTAFSAEPEYQQKVNAEKERVRLALKEAGETITAMSFGGILIQAKLEKARLEALVKEQNLIIESMNQELVDYLDSNDVVSLKMGNGISMSIKDDVYCSVSDKISFNQWIRDSGLEDLFSVHYQTMASMVKNKLIDGEEIPPGITPYFKQGITVRGVKNLEQGE
jgi:hypothetical protein